jgi:hypothetical protein
LSGCKGRNIPFSYTARMISAINAPYLTKHSHLYYTTRLARRLLMVSSDCNRGGNRMTDRIGVDPGYMDVLFGQDTWSL